MNILMFTNTYLPHVGGVARSVATFADAYRSQGHQCVVIAPTFQGPAIDDRYVVRVPAIERFNSSEFSVRLPSPGVIIETAESVQPDIIHAHHPFLLGDAALRLAARRNVPLVFTYHTMYERYTHYVPGDSPTLRQFVIHLATAYANLCDRVIAPSESIRDMLVERGVTCPIDAIPTGVDASRFSRGDGARYRKQAGVAEDAFVVGHVGRLAPEKNLEFLAQAVAAFVRTTGKAHFLVVGDGPSRAAIEQTFAAAGLSDRLHLAGTQTGEMLTDAYHAMNVFAFASETETQGMVLAEAMTAGVPVVAVDAPGAREIVRDRRNGRLIPRADAESFADALSWVRRKRSGYRELAAEARKTASRFTIERCASRTLSVYESLQGGFKTDRGTSTTTWDDLTRRIEAEWNLWMGRLEAGVETVTQTLA